MFVKAIIPLLFCSLFISGCFGSTITSSDGHYGLTPPSSEIKGSSGQTILKALVSHDTEDVKSAVKKAAGFNALFVDTEKENMLSGYGNWTPPGFTGGCSPSQVFAVYIKKNNDQQESEVTIVVDQLTFCASGTNPQTLLAQRLLSTMNRILATYE